MFRRACGSILSGVRLMRVQVENAPSKTTGSNLLGSFNKSFIKFETNRFYSSILSSNFKSAEGIMNKNTPIAQSNIMIDFNLQQKRNLTKFSLQKGKRKTVKTVVDRFYRLGWGIWIRTKCGRQKKMWKKPAARKRRLRQHVFCNAKQSTLLDKMTTKYWKKRRFYPDDPYEPYHDREEYPYTRKTPIS
ncbi:39S ribosomal protein L35, mitochondrial [Myzus persicae]|uniref:39S ribosomal protein L35, mitochondrial n=1 Tax=Myzus persicae TaxID=13164 RepID=UPI000B92FA12|nr:39S ribosomal protein L35, mitochondrial [Myzus persicae]